MHFNLVESFPLLSLHLVNDGIEIYIDHLFVDLFDCTSEFASGRARAREIYCNDLVPNVLFYLFNEEHFDVFKISFLLMRKIYIFV